MTKRRGRGEGGIYKKTDGLWCAQLAIGYDEQGTRRRRYLYGKTKKDVQKKLLEIQSSAASGTLLMPQKMRLAEYLKHWLEDVSRPGIRPTTYVLYEFIIRLHISAHIGGAPLNTLNSAQIQHLYRKLEDVGASAGTRSKVHMLLQKSLSHAVRLGYIQNNPCSPIQKPRCPRKPMKYWNAQQVQHFLKTAEGSRYYPLYLMALMTGMRVGELFGLQWQDVDLSSGFLCVQRTVYEIKGKLSIGEPKTGKGRRKIELPQKVLQELTVHKEKMLLENLETPWVFCDTLGGMLRQNNIRRRSWIPLVVKSGLPKIRFHDLRHTSATLLLSQGTHPKVVQERLGHAQISLTLDTYSHLIPSMQQEAALKLDNLFL